MRFSILIPLLACLNVSFGQQVPYINSDIRTLVWHNPASYGTWNNFSLNCTAQSVWPGIEGHPESFLVNFETQFLIKKNNLKSGLGMNLLFDRVGFQSRQLLSLNYNLQVKVGQKGRLSFGVSPAISNLTFKDPEWIGTDTIFADFTEGSQLKLVTGTGFMYYIPDRFYFGFSASPFMRTVYDELSFVGRTTYFFNGGYKYKVGRKMSSLISADFGFDQSMLKFSGMITFFFKKPGFSIGAGYSSAGEIKAQIGYQYKKLALVYFINFQPSNPLPGNQFVHELKFSYRIPNEVKCSTCEHF